MESLRYPVRIPTKRTQDVLHVRSAPSNAPSLWSSMVKTAQGTRDAKPTTLKKHVLRAASFEVDLMEAIAAYPGHKASFYAKEIKRPYIWTVRTLNQYEEDGLVEKFRENKSLVWRLL